MLRNRVKEKSDKVMWAEFRDGFFLCLRYVTQAEFRKIYDRCLTYEFDKHTHERKETLNEEKYAKELAAIIVDWRGLTPAVQRELFDMTEPATEDEPYAKDNAEILVQKAYRMVRWLADTITDLALFNAYEDAEMKKKFSPSSSAVSEHNSNSVVNSA